MHIGFTPEQLQLQAMLRRVAKEKVAPRANDIDRTAQYPEDMFSLLCELGLFALPFPEAHGGTGSLVSACMAIEELGTVCYNTAYLLAVQWTPFGAILAGGTDAQKWRLLPELLRNSIACLALALGFAALAVRPGSPRTLLQEWQKGWSNLLKRLRHRRTSRDSGPSSNAEYFRQIRGEERDS